MKRGCILHSFRTGQDAQNTGQFFCLLHNTVVSFNHRKVGPVLNKQGMTNGFFMHI